MAISDICLHLLLPNHPTLSVLDRFDILSSPAPTVPFWAILKALLSKPVTSISELIDLLESISFNLRGASNTDYGFLRVFLEQKWPRTDLFFATVWPATIKLALEMPQLFPGAVLESLTEENPRVALSRRQVACLVVHQFLCSLPAQPWVTDSSVDFHVWYSSDPTAPKAVQAYLHSLFSYFDRLVDESHGESAPVMLACSVDEWPIVFTLKSLHGNQVRLEDFHDSRLLPLEVTRLPEASTGPSILGLSGGACVISANKNVGFGSSGTQEETHVGSSPEACVVVLMTPTLKDAHVLIVEGPEAMVSMKGYGREARLDEVLVPDYDHTNAAMSMWQKRTMLFMDALELDLIDGETQVADLLPGHVERELRKAYTAFSSKHLKHRGYTEIFTGLWGCGAFAGDWQIKTIIQWCASSMGGINLHFLCAGDQQQAIAARIEDFARSGVDHGWTVGDLLKAMSAVDPISNDARNVFEYVRLTLHPNIATKAI